MTSPISAISGSSGTDVMYTGDDSVQGANTDFAGLLNKGLQNVQNTLSRSDDLAVKVADGTLQDPAQYTMAATEASLALSLTLAIRNKALDAFQEIMRMQA